MSWIAPKTWTYNELVTAVMMNAELRDRLIDLWPYQQKGDLAVATGSNNLTRLPAGANGYALVADSGQSGGLAWSNIAVSGGNAHAHINGQGGQIDHTNLANIGNTTHTQIDTILGALANTYAPIAKGVTNGDTHDHLGGDGASISGGAIQAGSITAIQIANGAVGLSQLATGAVYGSKIQDNGVGGAQIASYALANRHYSSGSISSDKIQTDAISTDKILNGAITGAKIASGAVGLSNLVSGILPRVAYIFFHLSNGTRTDANVSSTNWYTLRSKIMVNAGLFPTGASFKLFADMENLSGTGNTGNVRIYDYTNNAQLAQASSNYDGTVSSDFVQIIPGDNEWGIEVASGNGTYVYFHNIYVRVTW